METITSSLYFKVAETERELQECFKLRYQVYCKEKKWLPAENYPNYLETDEYDNKAINIIAMDEDFNLVGMIRILIAKDYNRLPFESHPGIKNKKMNFLNYAEISRLIVIGNENRNNIIKGLFRYTYQYSITNRIDKWVIVTEASVLRFFKFYHFFCEGIGLPAKYFGGITIPAVCDIKRNQSIWKRTYPESYKYYHEDYSIFSKEAIVAS